jgi:hypothetical protein
MLGDSNASCSAMWNSTSKVTEEGTKYGSPDLDALFNFVGCAIDLEELEVELRKDDECKFHYCAYLNGITNGEYIYAAFEILSEMIGDEPSKPAPFYKDAVLASILEGLEEEFLERINDEDFPIETAQDIWNLHAARCRNNKLPLWTDEDDKEIEPPSLKELKASDWELILTNIQDEFLWDRDWEIDVLAGSNFALVKEQPHFPTLQEYRTARTWLMVGYSNTRHNRQAREKAAASRKQAATSRKHKTQKPR